jgi:hypothetical protein
MSEVEESLVPGQGPFSTEGETQPELQADSKAEVTPKTEEAPKQEDKFAAKFAALSRQEKKVKQQFAELNRKAQEMQAREKEMTDRIAKLQQESEQYQARFSKIKDNPLQGLQEEFGTDFETLTKMQLNDQNPTPEMLIKRSEAALEAKYAKKLADLEAKIAEKEETAQKTQVENAKKQYMTAINEHVKTGGDKYELITANSATQLVYEVVEEYFNQNQKVLSVEEAADLVEKHLETEAKKVFELKKFKQTSQPPVAKTPGKQTAPTLSNSLSAERPVNGPKKLSAEESLREAAKMIRWED